MEFDEHKAIDFIKERLKETGGGNYDDDQILNVIDIIWDFYEENGLLEIDFDEDLDEDDILDDLITYVKRMLAKDRGSDIHLNDITAIVTAEIEYENSLEEI